MPRLFNSSFTYFPPKGAKQEDHRVVTRKPTEVRPLTLKNTDNKLRMWTNASVLNPQLKQITHTTQNGFVEGRNFLNNPVDIDAAARIYSTKYLSCDSMSPKIYL